MKKTKKQPKVPAKYLAGLSTKEKAKRKKEIAKNKKKSLIEENKNLTVNLEQVGNQY